MCMRVCVCVCVWMGMCVYACVCVCVCVCIMRITTLQLRSHYILRRYHVDFLNIRITLYRSRGG